ncbi:MAG: hypothetical protein PHD95_04160 [Candidatus ainarchaeum sp.]|nr:hypothetical protein [Candidatus ainarchaeum sp.]
MDEKNPRIIPFGAYKLEISESAEQEALTVSFKVFGQKGIRIANFKCKIIGDACTADKYSVSEFIPKITAARITDNLLVQVERCLARKGITKFEGGPANHALAMFMQKRGYGIEDSMAGVFRITGNFPKARPRPVRLMPKKLRKKL